MLTWTYDGTYQLTSEARTPGSSTTFTYSTSYTYDPLGNRLVKWDSGALTTSTYDAANQLETASGPAGVTTFSYDLTGNLTVQNAPAGITTSTWDNENRQIVVATPTGSPTTMSYNADGLRFEVVTGPGTTGTIATLWDGQSYLGYSYVPALLVETFTQEPTTYGGLLLSSAAQATRYMYDALGSVAAAWTQSTPTSKFYYKGFGEILGTPSNPASGFVWNGHEGYYYDHTTGWYYLRGRIYDPATGRFLSADPLGLGPDINWYRYAENNGINAADPSGMAVLDDIWGKVTAPTLALESRGRSASRSHRCRGRAFASLGRSRMMLRSAANRHWWCAVYSRSRLTLDFTSARASALASGRGYSKTSRDRRPSFPRPGCRCLMSRSATEPPGAPPREARARSASPARSESDRGRPGAWLHPFPGRCVRRSGWHWRGIRDGRVRRRRLHERVMWLTRPMRHRARDVAKHRAVRCDGGSCYRNAADEGDVRIILCRKLATWDLKLLAAGKRRCRRGVARGGAPQRRAWAGGARRAGGAGKRRCLRCEWIGPRVTHFRESKPGGDGKRAENGWGTENGRTENGGRKTGGRKTAEKGTSLIIAEEGETGPAYICPRRSSDAIPRGDLEL